MGTLALLPALALSGLFLLLLLLLLLALPLFFGLALLLRLPLLTLSGLFLLLLLLLALLFSPLALAGFLLALPPGLMLGSPAAGRGIAPEISGVVLRPLLGVLQHVVGGVNAGKERVEHRRVSARFLVAVELLHRAPYR